MDIARDGRRVVIATYGGIYELTQRAGETFDEIWDNAPKIVADNVAAQVEAVTYARDGAILFTEEAEHPRLWKSDRL